MDDKLRQPQAFPGALEHESGMSLRDYFAAAAIGPLMGSDGFEKEILNGGFPLKDLPRFAAEQAYEIADAMLAERSKP